MSRSSRRREPFKATPQFASPEHLRGQRLDVRSDIYAVGATLHYLLTGRPPFDDRNLMALVSRIATEPPPSLREVRPEVPRALAAAVLQCLAKDPAHRPASYRSLASVLEPLGSTVKTPAPLGIRVTVGVLDNFLSTFLLISADSSCFFRDRRRCSAQGRRGNISSRWPTSRSPRACGAHHSARRCVASKW